ncbi:GNAT family N-acetyltransferase [Ottowia testudinis]|uniref:GNAT family N-acetyltransferase n=1 Tax=Ottowia testudinis TaxID=2816950 RepID=A0A975CLJ7_9BURK|nr:GNAT family N-acetyltransferase [Ottowia testudinis]
MIFRRPTAEDASALASFYNDPAVYTGLLQLPYTDAAYWRKRFTEPSAGAAEFGLSLVVFRGDQLIANGGLFPAAPAVRRRHVLGLGMAVAGAWQARGIGSLLLRSLLEHADHWLGARRIELTVYTDNAAAIALYRKHGFEVEGTQREFAFRDGCYVDALMMARLASSLRAPL